MPSFAYTARETATGREIRNTVEAANEQTAIAALLNRNMLVVSIQEKISKKGKAQGGKVALSDLVVFTRQLATMIEAGIAIVQALQALAEQTPNKIMRDVIRDVCSRVESGDSFSEALLKHPKTFNKLYTSMISAGEKGGLLAEIMARLASYLEKTERLRKKVKTALMYPTAVTVVAIGITTFLLVKVIPTFKEVYSGFGAKLPGPTQVLMDISDVVRSYLILFVIAGGAAAWGWMYYIKTKSGREFWRWPAGSSCPSLVPLRTRFVWPVSPARLPRSSTAAVCRSLEVLQIVSQTVGNVVMEKAIKNAAVDIERGEGISAALGRKIRFFRSMVIRMLSAGEKTGNIDNML